MLNQTMTGTERKGLQKYYPPDFDPTKLSRVKQSKKRQWVQRVMAPFNMTCNTCGEFIYKGRKFNMQREPAGEFYLKPPILRFYFKCPNCMADISFKTDLENADYQTENGATRLFEAAKLWKDQVKLKEARDEENSKDPMKQLEKKMKASKKEMEAMGTLEEIQELNRRHEQAANLTDRYLEKYYAQEQDDEAEIRFILGKSEDGKYAKRICDDEEDDEALDLDAELYHVMQLIPKLQADAAKKRGTDQKDLLSKLVVVKKSKVEVKNEPKYEEDSSASPTQSSSSTSPKPPVTSSGLVSLSDYGSDDSD